ncbi:GerAB/ArcD/ProY family transporter [Priestia filamentosa]|uniref:GerAB/ArcD/ProY family transporter n=1 Tax=Priestia filamentosa TaxID=1402861 RepID=UPI0002F2F24D|nr:GerAB/ArcD/ProY family transporter [Priestia filamentosa]
MAKKGVIGMERAKISVIQLFSLMFIFNMGTAVVISYGATAGKDAWLAILLAICGGVAIFFIHYYPFRQYPYLLFTEYIRKIFGEYLGWMLGLIYCLFFLYICGRNVREFGDLIISSTLAETPLLAINLTFILVICYVIHLGVEVLGRTAEVFIVILIVLGASGNFLVLVSGDVDFERIRPVLEHGWKPILSTTFPTLITFPFGEMLVFTMLLPYLNRPKLVKRVWLSAVILSSLILSWTVMLNICVLGLETMKRSTFPLLTAVGKVHLLEFIERMDVIVVFTLLITVFFKASVYLYGGVIGIANLFKVENYNHILLPIGIVVIFLSLVMSSSFSEQTEEGVINQYVVLILFIMIPFMMVVVLMVRQYIKRKRH